jgi:hypothetical protein
MPYESVRCNECGAVLQVPSSARYVTCNHCNVSLEVHRTSVATYTEALPRPGASASPREADPAWREMADRLEYMERQNELARIDREWDMERERYMLYSRYGRRNVPSTTTSIVVGVIFGTMGIGMIAVGLVGAVLGRSPEGLVCCLPGLFFLLIGTVAAVVNYGQAQRYQRAYQEYLDRRSVVMGEPGPRRDEDY